MKKYYGSADGLRTIACIGIVMMHVAENSTYSIQGYLYDTIIPSFTDFVFSVYDALGFWYVLRVITIRC